MLGSVLGLVSSVLRRQFISSSSDSFFKTEKNNLLFLQRINAKRNKTWCFFNLNPPPRHGAPVSQGLIKFDTDYTERSCWWGCSSCSSKQINRSELCHNVWAARVITLWPGLSARRSVLWPVWPIRQCHDIIRDNTRRCDRVIVTVTNWQLTRPDIGALWHLIT